MVNLSSGNFNWSISNVNDVNDALNRLGKEISDFRIPFTLIASDFYRSQRKLFTLQSKGLYVDLSEWYKKQKQKEVGFIYPILVGKSRALSNSTLGRDNLYSKFSISATTMVIGTTVPYGKYHQSDLPRTRLPQRKFIFIDGGKGDKSKDGVNGRRERWIKIIDTHIDQLINGVS